MTTPVTNISRTNLNALDPNLATGQVADPALRKACFDEIYNYFDTFVTAYNLFIGAGGIATANLADLSVTTAKIALLAITAAQIANGTITTTQLATGAVTSTNILDGTILDADINASAAIAWTKLSKSGSSLADLTTRLASDLTGTLAASQLPAHTGEATSSAGSAALTLLNSAVIAKLITGYVKGAGIVATTDSILAAIQKLAGNDQRPSTSTVAASNSTAAGIAAADYVCTGTGDQATINTAIAALPVITVESGTAQAGAASTVTLSSTVASAVDNYYTGYKIVTTGGTGSGQTRTIAGYVGSTKVATVTSAWGTNPDATTTYNITSPSGKVVLLEGLFSIAAAITVPNNVTLEGQGNGTLIKLANGTNATTLLINNSDQVNGNSGIKIANLKIDGNKANNTGNQTGISFGLAYLSSIENVTIINCNNIGISISSSSVLTIFKNTCFNNIANGILLTSSSHSIISNNICYNNTTSGISFNSCSYNTVTNNLSENNGSNGIISTTVLNSLYSNNISRNNTNNGISIVTGCTGNTVSNNTCISNGVNGILLQGSSDNVISNNMCISNSQTTTATSDNIQVDLSANTNNIQGNTCRKGALSNLPRYGIRINTSNCTGNLVTNNDLTLGGTTGAYSDLGTSTITTGVGNKLA